MSTWKRTWSRVITSKSPPLHVGSSVTEDVEPLSERAEPGILPDAEYGTAENGVSRGLPGLARDWIRRWCKGRGFTRWLEAVRQS